MRITARHVAGFISSCLNEAEADGYQQQEDDPIHDIGVTLLGWQGTRLWIKVGDMEFEVKVTKKRGRDDS